MNAPTRFAIRWLENSERLLGVTEVLVHPPDLLGELKTLAGQPSLGVFDPDDQLKPLLRRVAVEFQDMEDSGFDAFRGELAMVGPFESRARIRESLASKIAMLAKRGVAVVWIRPPELSDRLMPSFYSVPTGRGTVLVAQAGLVARLADDPQSQLNLIELARQALHPEPARLPGLAKAPETNETP